MIDVSEATWNLGLVRLAKEFLFDAAFFVLLTTVGFVACQGRFSHLLGLWQWL